MVVGAAVDLALLGSSSAVAGKLQGDSPEADAFVDLREALALARSAREDGFCEEAVITARGALERYEPVSETESGSTPPLADDGTPSISAAHATDRGTADAWAAQPAWRTDGGYGEIGCALAVLSAGVGFVAVVAWSMLSGAPVPFWPAVLGMIAGLLLAMYTADLVMEVVSRIGPLRARAGDLGMAWCAVVPVVVVLAVVALLHALVLTF